MKSKTIEVNGVQVTCYEDGSIEKPHFSKGTVRTFGSDNGEGYRRVKVGAINFLVHRLCAEALLDDWSDCLKVDHINGIHDDNRVENLRMLNQLGQMQAFLGSKPNVRSKYRGVSEHKPNEKWRAIIQVDKVSRHIGLFSSEQAAAIAYDRAAEEAGFDQAAFNKTHHPELSMLSGAY